MRWALVGALMLGAAGAADAQSARVYQVGVVHLGGPYQLAVDGLRAGLKEQGIDLAKGSLADSGLNIGGEVVIKDLVVFSEEHF